MGLESDGNSVTFPQNLNKFIMFKKHRSSDTNYVALKFSNTGIEFTIHEFFSSCKTNYFLNTNSPELKKPTFYPNPANDYISISKNLDRVTIYSLSGELLITEEHPSNSISIEELSIGIYVIELVSKKHSYYSTLIKAK